MALPNVPLPCGNGDMTTRKRFFIPKGAHGFTIVSVANTIISFVVGLRFRRALLTCLQMLGALFRFQKNPTTEGFGCGGETMHVSSL